MTREYNVERLSISWSVNKSPGGHWILSSHWARWPGPGSEYHDNYLLISWPGPRATLKIIIFLQVHYPRRVFQLFPPQSTGEKRLTNCLERSERERPVSCWYVSLHSALTYQSLVGIGSLGVFSYHYISYLSNINAFCQSPDKTIRTD